MEIFKNVNCHIKLFLLLKILNFVTDNVKDNVHRNEYTLERRNVTGSEVKDASKVNPCRF